MLVQLVAQTHLFEGFHGSAAALGPGHAGDGQCQLHVGEHRLVGDKVIALEHETNGVVAVGVPVAVGVLLGGDAVDDQVTAIIAVKAADDVEQCGFAGAAGAQDGDKLIVTEVQADIVEGDLFQIACFVFLADFFKLKHIPAFLGNGPEPDACFRPCKPGCPEVCRTRADRKITR